MSAFKSLRSYYFNVNYRKNKLYINIFKPNTDTQIRFNYNFLLMEMMVYRESDFANQFILVSRRLIGTQIADGTFHPCIMSADSLRGLKKTDKKTTVDIFSIRNEQIRY